LPVVWIPPTGRRDQRERLRWRMYRSGMRTGVKNRVHGVGQRDTVDIGVSDLFGDGGRAKRLARLGELPPYSGQSTLNQRQRMDSVETQLRECEQIRYPRGERDRVDSLPCVGKILSAVMALEIGDGRRFSGPDHRVSYTAVAISTSCAAAENSIISQETTFIMPA